MGDEDLLARMMRTKADWGPGDLEQLYTSFGFDKREGAKHTLYVHPIDPQRLRATVSRHRPLPTGYIQTAIRHIRLLKQIESEAQR